MFLRLTDVQNHITTAIDTANLRWLLVARPSQPKFASKSALIPDDAHPFPTLLLLPMGAAVEFVWLAFAVFFPSFLDFKVS